MIFSNREVYRRGTKEKVRRSDVATGITVKRILASCSIPLVYPWTYDSETKAHYWDGALVANTPLGAALDVIGDAPINTKVEVVVVLMTPWRKDSTIVRERPKSFGEAITWTLDWTLLASFRERLRLINAYNELAKRLPKEEKEKFQYREVNVVVVAPDKFVPAKRIIDYDGAESKDLIKQGHNAAENKFKEMFPG
jgi:NTE family protein